MQKNKENTENVKYDAQYSGVGGQIAGGQAGFLQHPQEQLKVRSQADNGIKRLKTYEHSKYIYKNEGIKGFWSGVYPNVFGSCIAWGLYLCIYTSGKEYIEKYNKNSIQTISNGGQLLSAFIASCIASGLTNPFFLLKTRACLYTQGSDNIQNINKTQQNYKLNYKNTNMIRQLYSLIHNEGISVQYRGYSASFLNSFQASVQMVQYENFKRIIRHTRNISKYNELSSYDITICTCSSKQLSSIALYPCQVIKTHLQDDRKLQKKFSFFRTSYNIYMREGYRGFYYGLGQQIFRSIPNTIIIFYLYERISHALSYYHRKNF